MMMAKPMISISSVAKIKPNAAFLPVDAIWFMPQNKKSVLIIMQHEHKSALGLEVWLQNVFLVETEDVLNGFFGGIYHTV